MNKQDQEGKFIVKPSRDPVSKAQKRKYWITVIWRMNAKKVYIFWKMKQEQLQWGVPGDVGGGGVCGAYRGRDINQNDDKRLCGRAIPLHLRSVGRPGDDKVGLRIWVSRRRHLVVCRPYSDLLNHYLGTRFRIRSHGIGVRWTDRQTDRWIERVCDSWDWPER